MMQPIIRSFILIKIKLSQIMQMLYFFRPFSLSLSLSLGQAAFQLALSQTASSRPHALSLVPL